MRNAFTHHDHFSDDAHASRPGGPGFNGFRGFGGPEQTQGEPRGFARRGGGPQGGPGFERPGSAGHDGDRHEHGNRGFGAPAGGFGRGFGRPGGFDGFGEDFGPGFGGRGRGGHGGRGPGRGRRGDVRAAILAILREEPMNGYGLISAIAEKSDGLWKPGAGSVYPALGLLEDEGLIHPDVDGRKKTYSLTDEGRTYVDEHADEVTAPWERVAAPHSGILDLRPELHQLAMALRQVSQTGDDAQITAARSLLEKTRKDVYRLLAGDLPQE